MQVVPKILIVDDEQRMCESLKTLLNHHGYEVSTSNSGEQALEYLSENEFDLVLLDIVMPGINGFVVLEKAIAIWPKTSVVVMTGDVSVESAIAALRHGANDYIKKPFEHEELLRRIYNALEQKKLIQEKNELSVQLDRSEERYRHLVQTSPDLIYTLDHKGVFTFLNDAVNRLLGCSAERLLGKHYSSIIYDEDCKKAQFIFNERRTGNRAAVGSELRLKGAQSFNQELDQSKFEPLVVEVKATGLYHTLGLPGGKKCFLGSYGFARDVTGRKKAEEALRKSEERYRALFENNPVETIIVNRRGEVTDFNLVKRKAGHRLPNVGDVMYKDYAGKHEIDMFGELMNCIRTGKSKTFPERKYGDRFLHIRISPFLNGAIVTSIDISLRKRTEEELFDSIRKKETAYEQSIIYAQELIEEIGERKKAEEALRESNVRYRTLLEAAPDSVVVYDMDGKVVYINPAFTRTFGWLESELLGKQIDYVPKDKWLETRKLIESVLSGKGFSGFETQRCTKDGGVIDVSISASVYHDREGKPQGSVIALRDITERKKLEVQLQRAQKMEAIGTLAGGIAHDFNNLLMAIQGNASLMRYDMDSSHPLYEGLKNIEKHVKSGSKLTAQLLGYARKGKYDIRPVSLNQITEEISQAFGRTRKGITIYCELAEDLSPIRADKGQIEQVLLNLFVNAADAMTSGGKLTVKTTNVTHSDLQGRGVIPKPGEYVLLIVADTGTGMERKTQDRIFDPFFTTKSMGRGTGLGLASVYGIVTSHGGYIDVETSPGVGTTFFLFLPACKSPVTASVGKQETVVKGMGTILIVDDEDIILDVGTRILEKLGYTVLQSSGGAEAVRIYEHNKDAIDLVLLDMIMPGMGGGEVFDKLKAMNPRVKVLLSSGYSIDGQAKDIMERGCDGFIQKPFSLDELSGKIRKTLNTK